MVQTTATGSLMTVDLNTNLTTALNAGNSVLRLKTWDHRNWILMREDVELSNIKWGSTVSDTILLHLQPQSDTGSPNLFMEQSQCKLQQPKHSISILILELSLLWCKFQVFKVDTVQSVTPCNQVSGYQHYGGAGPNIRVYCKHVHNPSTVNMEAAYSSETIIST